MNESLDKLWEAWHKYQTQGALTGTYQRFGQYFINNYCSKDYVDPEIFYEKDDEKAYHLISLRIMGSV